MGREHQIVDRAGQTESKRVQRKELGMVERIQYNQTLISQKGNSFAAFIKIHK